MDKKVKTLLSFLTSQQPDVLLTPCKMMDEPWIDDLGGKSIKCTATKCEDDDKNCITMHPTGMYLPLNRFDVWIIDLDNFPYTPGYAFYLGHSSMKQFGIIVLKSIPDDSMDSVALSYGFQTLYHGDWHYYLKSS